MTESETPSTASSCVHHWLVESPNGPTSLGTCKSCGAQKFFYNNAGYPEAMPSQPEPALTSTASAPEKPVPAAAPRKILLVDDERPLRQMLTTLLESDGYQVTPVASADDALRSFGETRADLVLLDLMMPGLPPRTFVSHIRAASKTPILVLSANPEALELGHLIGADDAMEKPFDPEQLVARVASLINLGSQADV